MEEITPEDLLHTPPDEEVAEEPTLDCSFPVVSSASSILEDTTFLGYTSCLLSLAKLRVEPSCSKRECGAAYSLTVKHVGTAVVLTWVSILLNNFMHI